MDAILVSMTVAATPVKLWEQWPTDAILVPVAFAAAQVELWNNQTNIQMYISVYNLYKYCVDGLDA